MIDIMFSTFITFFSCWNGVEIDSKCQCPDPCLNYCFGDSKCSVVAGAPMCECIPPWQGTHCEALASNDDDPAVASAVIIGIVLAILLLISEFSVIQTRLLVTICIV